jgi:hypothetical protein
MPPNEAHHMMMNGMCKCPHHKVVPGLITLIGLLFLMNALGWLSAGTLAWTWPLALTLIGVMKLSRGMCKCCSEHGKCGGAGCAECMGDKKPEMGGEKKM